MVARARPMRLALTDGRLITLDRRDVLLLLRTHPSLALAVIEILCERLRRTSTQVEELSSFLPARGAARPCSASPRRSAESGFGPGHLEGAGRAGGSGA